MPIYEYRCTECGADFELMRPMSKANEPAACPKCGAASEKLVSAFGSQIGYFVRAPAGPAFRKPPDEENAINT